MIEIIVDGVPILRQFNNMKSALAFSGNTSVFNGAGRVEFVDGERRQRSGGSCVGGACGCANVYTDAAAPTGAAVPTGASIEMTPSAALGREPGIGERMDAALDRWALDSDGTAGASDVSNHVDGAHHVDGVENPSGEKSYTRVTAKKSKKSG